ncbi:DNA (cytosine-5)-methyltransferase DRM2-like [Prosopis cineraria]|uniref:DNA (cytosine-5)-methyltransferase DRM2-like n=1 Tax=Prosopis cineraria TaxID=364024 RepID=UPI00240F7620|nr:DNA (cytosine-5)-methyltransferase DRM2-like [Prosopis cineraria]
MHQWLMSSGACLGRVNSSHCLLMDAIDDSWENNIDWTTDDELEVFDMPSQDSLRLTNTKQESVKSSLKENTRMIKKDETLSMLVDMGYAIEEALIAMDQCGINTQMSELIDFICAARVGKETDSNFNIRININPTPLSIHSKRQHTPFIICGASEKAVVVDAEDEISYMLEKDETLSTLVDMGFTMEEALIALDKHGLEAEISELTDFICAARLEKEIDSQLQNSCNEKHNGAIHALEKSRYTYSYTTKRMKLGNEKWKSRICRASEKKAATIDKEEVMHLPNPMIGFSTPNEFCTIVERKLPEIVDGPPYFYYENVAITPKGVWSKISRFLYEIEPEFVDSKFFCAAARKRGYIHNLPIHNRYPLAPSQPLNIAEALPSTSKWWPSWDKRTKLNCLQTCIASAKLTERIRKKLEQSDGEPPQDVQVDVLQQCKKWNLVWVGKNKLAPLEPDELELLMGFPRHHTRGGGINRTDRYKALGNAFQVDTVAYHLSVLKDRFPNGMNVLSLFSGIGGAEVALHRLGITLKNVVSVEISEVNRNIIHSWWEQTNQTGNLIEFEDVQEVSADKLESWMASFGGFDLVIGGSPCNNLTGANRVSRIGLEGKDSSLFYEYFRILDQLKTITRANGSGL